MINKLDKKVFFYCLPENFEDKREYPHMVIALSEGLKKLGKMSYICKRIYRKMGWRSTKVLQWDSWRLWESWGAECVTFHLDFEKYGVKMPVMPENWKHYIGIDLDNIQDAIDRIKDEPEILAKIAEEGRKWAIKHYSPLPTARRFLRTVGEQISVS